MGQCKCQQQRIQSHGVSTAVLGTDSAALHYQRYGEPLAIRNGTPFFAAFDLVSDHSAVYVKRCLASGSEECVLAGQRPARWLRGVIDETFPNPCTEIRYTVTVTAGSVTDT